MWFSCQPFRLLTGFSVQKLMGCSQRLFLFTAFALFAAAIDGAHGYAMVTGTVFCDQCKDGQVSLFDYPIYGIKVTMSCPGSDGQFTTLREETTNWLGNYAIRFDGTPDLSGCYAQLSGGGQGPNGCGLAAGPAKNPRLIFGMFDMEMYTVDPLLTQPTEPMPFCPRSSGPVGPARPPPQLPPPLPPVPQLPPPLPPVPQLPPVPFLQGSTCPHQIWTMPEHRCYWKVVTPDTRVSIVFGLVAGRVYGPDVTLAQAMSGRGDPYKTLLREGTTALLNSYNSLTFPFNSLDVIQRVNWALLGSTRLVLHTALSFMKANSGTGTNSSCTFTSCN